MVVRCDQRNQKKAYREDPGRRARPAKSKQCSRRRRLQSLWLKASISYRQHQKVHAQTRGTSIFLLDTERLEPKCLSRNVRFPEVRGNRKPPSTTRISATKPQVAKAQNRGLVGRSQFYPALPNSQNGSMRQIAEPPTILPFLRKETAGRGVGMLKRGQQVWNLPHTSGYDSSIMAKYTRGDYLRCNRQAKSYMITLADIASAISCVSHFCNTADLAYAA